MAMARHRCEVRHCVVKSAPRGSGEQSPTLPTDVRRARGRWGLRTSADPSPLRVNHGRAVGWRCTGGARLDDGVASSGAPVAVPTTSYASGARMYW